MNLRNVSFFVAFCSVVILIFSTLEIFTTSHPFSYVVFFFSLSLSVSMFYLLVYKSKQGVTINEKIDLNEFQSLVDKKENLESQVIQLQKSATAIYKTFKALEALNPTEVILGAELVVKTALNPKKFSFYELGTEGFETVTAYGWEDNDPFLRRLPINHPITMHIARKRRQLVIKQKEDEIILQNQGLLAAPLINTSNGEVFGMLKVEEMDPLYFTAYGLDTFKTICEIISISYSNAKQYRKVKREEPYDEDLELFNYNLYHKQTSYLKNIASYTRTPLSLITIRHKYTPEELKDDKRTLIYTFVYALKKILPETTQCFKGRYRAEILLLLPFTDIIGAEKLIDLIVKEMQAHPTLNSHRFSASCELIYQGNPSTL